MEAGDSDISDYEALPMRRSMGEDVKRILAAKPPLKVVRGMKILPWVPTNVYAKLCLGISMEDSASESSQIEHNSSKDSINQASPTVNANNSVILTRAQSASRPSLQLEKITDPAALARIEKKKAAIKEKAAVWKAAEEALGGYHNIFVDPCPPFILNSTEELTDDELDAPDGITKPGTESCEPDRKPAGGDVRRVGIELTPNLLNSLTFLQGMDFPLRDRGDEAPHALPVDPEDISRNDRSPSKNISYNDSYNGMGCGTGSQGVPGQGCSTPVNFANHTLGPIRHLDVSAVVTMPNQPVAPGEVRQVSRAGDRSGERFPPKATSSSSHRDEVNFYGPSLKLFEEKRRRHSLVPPAASAVTAPLFATPAILKPVSTDNMDIDNVAHQLSIVPTDSTEHISNITSDAEPGPSSSTVIDVASNENGLVGSSTYTIEKNEENSNPARRTYTIETSVGPAAGNVAPISEQMEINDVTMRSLDSTTNEEISFRAPTANTRAPSRGLAPKPTSTKRKAHNQSKKASSFLGEVDDIPSPGRAMFVQRAAKKAPLIPITPPRRPKTMLSSSVNMEQSIAMSNVTNQSSVNADDDSMIDPVTDPREPDFAPGEINASRISNTKLNINNKNTIERLARPKTPCSRSRGSPNTSEADVSRTQTKQTCAGPQSKDQTPVSHVRTARPTRLVLQENNEVMDTSLSERASGPSHPLTPRPHYMRSTFSHIQRMSAGKNQSERFDELEVSTQGYIPIDTDEMFRDDMGPYSCERPRCKTAQMIVKDRTRLLLQFDDDDTENQREKFDLERTRNLERRAENIAPVPEVITDQPVVQSAHPTGAIPEQQSARPAEERVEEIREEFAAADASFGAPLNNESFRNPQQLGNGLLSNSLCSVNTPHRDTRRRIIVEDDQDDVENTIDNVSMEMENISLVDEGSSADESVVITRRRREPFSATLVPREIIKPETPPDGLRRSKRTKMKPARRWLGERAQYVNSPSGGLRLVGPTKVEVTDKRFLKYGVADVEYVVSRKNSEKATQRAIRKLEEAHRRKLRRARRHIDTSDDDE